MSVVHDVQGSWLQWSETSNGIITQHRQFITPELKSAISGASRKEMAIPRSRPMRLDAEPDDFVTFRNVNDDGTSDILACGSRIKIGKESDLLLTAHHVWTCVMERGLPVYLQHGIVAQPIRDDWKIYARSRELDFVIVRVPNHVWSRLGVSPIKISSQSYQASSVQTVGYINGALVKTYGVIKTFPNCPLGLLHTCTTIPSFSGSILRKGDVAVGLHVQAAPPSVGVYNIAIALGFLPGVDETLDEKRKVWRREIEDLASRWEAYDQEHDAIIEFEDRAYRAGNNGNKYFLWEEEGVSLDGRSWGDYMDELDEPVHPWELEDRDYGHSALGRRGVKECAYLAGARQQTKEVPPPQIKQEVVEKKPLLTRSQRQRLRKKEKTAALKKGASPSSQHSIVEKTPRPRNGRALSDNKKHQEATQSLSVNDNLTKKRAVPTSSVVTPGTASTSSSTSATIRGKVDPKLLKACAERKPVIPVSALGADNKGKSPKLCAPPTMSSQR